MAAARMAWFDMLGGGGKGAGNDPSDIVPWGKRATTRTRPLIWLLAWLIEGARMGITASIPLARVFQKADSS